MGMMGIDRLTEDANGDRGWRVQLADHEQRLQVFRRKLTRLENELGVNSLGKTNGPPIAADRHVEASVRSEATDASPSEHTAVDATDATRFGDVAATVKSAVATEVTWIATSTEESLGFEQRSPPGPVIVTEVSPGGWADRKGMRVGFVVV